MDVTTWKLERDALDGTFDAARNLLTKYGPWKLPAGLGDSFPEIALSTLSKVSRCVSLLVTRTVPFSLLCFVCHSLTLLPQNSRMCSRSKDRYRVFAAAVSESEAPDYGEIVTNPMDFGRMKEKVEEGLYGSGSSATAALYRDFLLVFDNCRLYNTDESEVTEEASRILALVPEAYASSCAAAQKKSKP
jgi:Bromodomain